MKRASASEPNKRSLEELPLINEKTIDNIKKHPSFYRGHIRTALGRVYKTDEFERKSDKVLEDFMQRRAQ